MTSLLSLIISFLPYTFITVNDVACAADTVSKTLYFPVSSSIPLRNDSSLVVKVTPQDSSCSIFLDSSLVNGDSLLIAQPFEREHELRLVEQDTISLWKVAFTTLPVVALTTASGNPIGEAEQKGTFLLIDPDRRTEKNSSETLYQSRLRVRGGSSRNYTKKSYAVGLTDDAGEDRDVSIMGIREHHNWVLDAMAMDKSRMRNRVIFDIWNDYSSLPYNKGKRNGTVGHHVEVVCNGQYLGLYVLSDKVNRDLLGLKSSKEREDKKRGVIYKSYIASGTTSLACYEDEPGEDAVWEGWKITYPDFEDSEYLWEPLVDLIDFVSDDSDEGRRDFRKHYQEHFYEENLLDYMTLILAFNLRDNLDKNLYMSVRNMMVEQQFLLTPWDLDCSLGGDWNGQRYDQVSAPMQLLNVLYVYRMLWADNIDNYRAKQFKNWNRHREGTLSESSVFRRLTSYADLLKQSGAWRRDYDRWNGVDFVLEPEVDAVVEYMKGWYSRNVEFLDNWFDGPEGIADVRLQTEDEVPAVYTLEGKRCDVPLSQLKAGVYVVDGKKYIK